MWCEGAGRHRSPVKARLKLTIALHNPKSKGNIYIIRVDSFVSVGWVERN